jgi:peroxiredoxin
MKPILAVLLSLIILNLQAQNDQPKSFTVSGNLHKIKDNIVSVQLYYIQNGQGVLDSSMVKDGKYSFKGDLAEPTISRLRAVYKPGKDGKARPINQQRDLAYLFIEPGKILVSHADSFSHTIVSGSPSHADFVILEKRVKPYARKLDSLYARYGQYRNSGDMMNLVKTQRMIDSLDRQMNEKAFFSFIKEHPASPVSLLALNQFAGNGEIDLNTVEPLFNTLAPNVQNSTSGKALKERIDMASRTSVGSEALDFTQNDTAGNPLKLSSFRGKYLLVDFWASWCGPCRQENPNVVKAFNKYKDRGFYVLGVSLDKPDGREKWLQAIHDDGLQWAQVSDLQFWNNAVAKLYGIQAIPQNLLLDPKGIIIGKNLRGEELDRKLAELFGN